MLYEFIDTKKTMMRIKVETMDDLWLLYTLLKPGDLVKMRTFREIKQGEKGSGSSKRIPMILTIKLKHMEFQPFTNKLRIRGIIIEGPERFGLQGSHHTLSVSVGDELTIIREEGWSHIDVKRLDESRRYHGSILIIAIDYDEFGMALLRRQGLKNVLEKELRLPGKDDEDRHNILKRILKELAELIDTYCRKENCNTVIVGGPGFLKDDLIKEIKTINSSLTVIKENASMGGKSGINEIIKRGKPLELLREQELSIAETLLEEALKRLVKEPGKVVFGYEECYNAALQSAIEDLLVLDELLSDFNWERRKKLEEIIRLVDKNRGKIHIVPSSTPAGERIYGMGGLVGLLRFSISNE